MPCLFSRALDEGVNQRAKGMDTVEIGIFEGATEKEILTQIQSVGSFLSVGKRARGYDRAGAFQAEGHHFYFKWGRRHLELPVLKVNFSLSKFDSFQDFLKWSDKVFGKFQPMVIDGKIYRFDACIDLYSSFKSVHSSLVQPRARSERVIKSKGKTYQLGRHPRKTTVYEKTIKTKNLDQRKKKHRTSDPESEVSGTRVEVQQWGKKIPIGSLRDIDKLRTINPFSHLQTLEKPLIPDDLPLKTKQILWAFQQRCGEVGTQQARKEFNQNRNFSRTVGKYIGKNQKLNLERYWQRRVKRFLGDQPVFPAKDHK